VGAPSRCLLTAQEVRPVPRRGSGASGATGTSRGPGVRTPGWCEAVSTAGAAQGVAVAHQVHGQGLAGQDVMIVMLWAGSASRHKLSYLKMKSESKPGHQLIYMCTAGAPGFGLKSCPRHSLCCITKVLCCISAIWFGQSLECDTCNIECGSLGPHGQTFASKP
jgi:hypothetical protein